MANKRNPSFEILRVVAMFLIVVWHFLIHDIGNKPLGIADNAPALFNLCSIELIGCLSKISTNCYILISGYFLIASAAKWRKIPKTWMPIFFYSVVICIAFMLFSGRHIGWERLGEAALPLFFDKYWFATRYVALVALAPFLSIVAHNISRNQYLTLLAILFVLNFNILLGQHLSGNNSMLWFIFLFYVGGYIRLHFKATGKNNFGKYYFLSAIVLAISFQAKRFMLYSLHDAPFMIDYHDNNGIEFVTALCLFLWAARWKSPDTRFVRSMARIAPFTFGVYLLHDNEFIRPLLWQSIHAKDFYDSWLFLPLLAASTAAIFLCCIAIDAMRDRLFRLLRINGHIDAIADKLNRRFSKE